MSSQIEDICAPGAREIGVVFVNEPSRMVLGGLWLEDIARMRIKPEPEVWHVNVYRKPGKNPTVGTVRGNRGVVDGPAGHLLRQG